MSLVETFGSSWRINVEYPDDILIKIRILEFFYLSSKVKFKVTLPWTIVLTLTLKTAIIRSCKQKETAIHTHYHFKTIFIINYLTSSYMCNRNNGRYKFNTQQRYRQEYVWDYKSCSEFFAVYAFIKMMIEKEYLILIE